MKPLADYQIRTTRMTVQPTTEPIFSELATHISIVDEAGGEFLKITQTNDDAEPGTITITAAEWPHIKSAVEQMLANLQDDEEATP